MIDHRVSRRYAKALLGLLKSEEDLEKTQQSFLKIREMIDHHPEITRLALNSTISQSEKEDLMDKLFAPQIGGIVIHFLKVLIEKRRFGQLISIQEEFHRLYEKLKGIQHVEVITASAINSKTEERLVLALKKKLKADIRLQTHVDAGILGGMIIRFGGNEINASFKNKLSKMRQLLLA